MFPLSAGDRRPVAPSHTQSGRTLVELHWLVAFACLGGLGTAGFAVWRHLLMGRLFAHPSSCKRETVMRNMANKKQKHKHKQNNIKNNKAEMEKKEISSSSEW
jgi:hypothetical protein